MPDRVVVSRLVLLALVVSLAAVLFWSQAATGQSGRQQANDCRLYVPMVGNHFLTYFEGPNEVEPNDSYLEANGPIRSGANYQGYPNDQRDWFSFYMALDGQINVSLNNHTGQGVQLQLFYQDTGNLVTFDSDDPYQISYAGAAGWYYIYIFTASGTNSSTLYTLNATYAVPPTPMPVTPVATPTCPPAGVTSTSTNTPTPSWTPTATFTPTPSNTPAISPTPTATLPPGWYEVGDGSATNGGISNNSGFSDRPSLAVGANGTPYIAWYDDSSGNSEIYVRRWNGNSWEEVGAGSATGGGISNNSGNSLYPSVAITSDNTPYVAWFDNDAGDNEIYVRHWNGSSWEEVGAGSASGGGISNNSGNSYDPSMAITAGGTPYVAWEDHSGGDSEIYVRRWNGSNWEEVGGGSATGGGISNNSGTSFYSSVAIAPNDTPYVAWQDDSGGNPEIYARRWNGSSWEEVGTGSASGGGISDNAGDSRIPSASISPGGIPYISWHDNTSGNNEIYVLRWNGSSWEEAGAGSASGGGISNNAGLSESSSLAIGEDDTPYVAWQDNSSGNYEVYIRRWNGSSWEEVGIGSASSGGISNNSGASGDAEVAIAPDGIPYVVWQNETVADYEIYVRRWLE